MWRSKVLWTAVSLIAALSATAGLALPLILITGDRWWIGALSVLGVFVFMSIFQWGSRRRRQSG